jgi:hypothetical protein
MTTNEQITVQAEAFNNAERAEEIVKTMSSGEIVTEIKRLLDTLDASKAKAARQEGYASQYLQQRNNWQNRVTEFIKDKVKEDAVDIDDLKDLAEELDIKLVKSIRVTFNVACEYEFEVPLDFDEDNIDDSDFDIRISSNVSDDDVEETSESFEVEDFEVTDND